MPDGNLPETVRAKVFSDVKTYVILGVVGSHLRCQEEGVKDGTEVMVAWGHVIPSDRGKFQQAIKAYGANPF